MLQNYIRRITFIVLFAVTALVYSIGAVQGQSEKSVVNNARKWRDATGVFVIEGTLAELSPSSVTLLLDDGTKRKVQRTSLNSEDQNYLIEFEKQSNPFLANTKKLESPTQDSNEQKKPWLNVSQSDQPVPGTSEATANSEQIRSSTAAPDRDTAFKLSWSDSATTIESLTNVVLYTRQVDMPGFETNPQTRTDVEFGRAFIGSKGQMARTSESSIFPVDLGRKLFAVGSADEARTPEQKTESSIYLGQLPSGPFRKVVKSDERVELLDYAPDSDLAFVSVKHIGNRNEIQLQIIAGLAHSAPQVKYAFTPPSEMPMQQSATAGVYLSELISGKILNDELGIVVYRGIVYCFQLADGSQVFQSEPIPNGFVAFSNDKSTFAYALESGIFFGDCKTGTQRGFAGVTIPGIHSRISMAFDPTGKRIAYCQNNQWGIYDYHTKTLQPPQYSSGISQVNNVNWLNDSLIVLDQVVLDIDHQIPVWFFGNNSWGQAYFWKDKVSIFEGGNNMQCSTLPIVHSPLEKRLAFARAQSPLLAVGPGTHVSLKIDVSKAKVEEGDDKKLQEILEKLISQANWVIDADSTISVNVEFRPGTLQERDQSVSNNPYGNQPTMTSPQIQVAVRDSEELLWQTNLNAQTRIQYSNNRRLSEEEQKLLLSQFNVEMLQNLRLPHRIPKSPDLRSIPNSTLSSGAWMDK